MYFDRKPARKQKAIQATSAASQTFEFPQPEALLRPFARSEVGTAMLIRKGSRTNAASQTDNKTELPAAKPSQTARLDVLGGLSDLLNATPRRLCAA
jgi:hypothetical protein